MSKVRLGPTTHLLPMPTILIAVKTGEGRANVLTVAWAGVVAGDPPMLAIEIGTHYSTPFLERERCFTANIPSTKLVAQADYCGMVSGREDPDKPGTCGFTLLPATKVSAPLIAECPLNFECRIVREVPTAKGRFYLAEIVETHVDAEAVEGETILPLKLDPLIFTPDGYYHQLGPRVGQGWSAGEALKKPSA